MDIFIEYVVMIFLCLLILLPIIHFGFGIKIIEAKNVETEALNLDDELKHYTLIKFGEHAGCFLYNPQCQNSDELKKETDRIRFSEFDYNFSDQIRDKRTKELLTEYAKGLVSAVGK